MAIKNEHIVFEKAYNFRDIGGLKTKENRRIKRGLIYRSDELSKLTIKDLEQLHKLGIQYICDLRTDNERKSKPDRLPTKSTITTEPISIHDQSQNYTHLEFMKMLIKSKELDFHKIMKDFYHGMATERHAEIKRVFEQLSSSENSPALIHCTGGKDRTGFITALIQLVVGVEYEQVIEHYLYSNELIGPRMDKVAQFIQLLSFFRVTKEQIKPILIVERDYLDDIFQPIFTQYGTVENYLIKGCGIEKGTLNQLRKLVLD
ncbi:tyrosine-protein phosphatase [Bacillus sp. AK128]